MPEGSRFGEGMGVVPMGPDGLNSQRFTQTATIADGASLSGVVDCSGGTLSRIGIPASWTTANLTFSTSPDGVTFSDLYDSFGTEYTVTVGGSSRAIIVPIIDFIGVRFLKIRSGTTGTPVNQSGAKALTLTFLP